MALARTNGPGFGVGVKMTSAQATAIDANIEGALDKRAAQTDTLSSAITMASGSSLTCASGSTLTCQVGSTLSVQGACLYTTTATLTIVCPVSVNTGGGSLAVNAPMTVGAPGTITCATGTSLTMASGSTMAINGAVTRVAHAVQFVRQTLLAQMTADFNTVSTIYVDATELLVTVPDCLVGDILVINAAVGSTTLSSGTGACYGRIVVMDPGLIVLGGEIRMPVYAGFESVQPIASRHVVATAGSILVKAQAYTVAAASTASLRAGSTLVVTHIRP